MHQQKIKAMEPIVGTWAELIADIFFWDEVVKFSTDLKKMRELPFEEVFGDKDYFKYFKEVDLKNIKAVYVKEFNDKPEDTIREIELDLFDGFSLQVSAQRDYEWLHIQGVMVFPRYYTWGSSSIFHKQWCIITDYILKRLVQHKYIAVCTSNPEVIKSVTDSNSATKIIGQGPDCWSKIKSFIDDDLKQPINWIP